MDILFKKGKKDVGVYFTGGGWGDCIYWNEEYRTISGFKPRGYHVSDGCILIDHDCKVYEISNVEYCFNPHDAFHADVSYIGTIDHIPSTVGDMCSQFKDLNEKILANYQNKYTNWFSRLFHYPDLIDDIYLNAGNTYTYKGF